MDLNNCPVSLVELKQHLRIYTDEMDGELTICLIAAAVHIEDFTLLVFANDYKDVEIPYPLKAAILMTAGRLFECPTDSVFNLPTASQALVKPYKRWDRIRPVVQVQ